VGLFSFLAGKKDDELDVVDDATPAPSAAVTPPAEPPPAPAPASPFTPPEAWGLDVGALTEPAPTTGDVPQIGPADAAVTAELQPKVVEVIKTVFDPEIPVDIYELGLIYDIIADADRRVLVKMTLTSPACPSAQQIPSEVRWKVKAIEGVKDCSVEIVWEPTWTKERMSEAAKMQLGMW